jgi:hypothetical protein
VQCVGLAVAVYVLQYSTLVGPPAGQCLKSVEVQMLMPVIMSCQLLCFAAQALGPIWFIVCKLWNYST